MATHYLDYFVYLTDAAQVKALQDQYPQGQYLAPASAASTYSAPIEGLTDAFVAPCTRSSWFSSTANYPRDQVTFKRKKGGFFGAIASFFGAKDTYWWLGFYAFAAPVATSDPKTGTPVPAGACPMPQRRFICGFEGTPSGSASPQDKWLEGPDNVGAAVMASRSASRVPGGLGLAMRGDQGMAEITMTFFSGGGAATNHRTWERMRVRRLNSGVGGFYSALSAGSVGVFLAASGPDIIVYNGATGTSTVIGTFSNVWPTVGQWALLDILVEYSDGTNPGSISLFVNHVLKATLTVAAGGAGIGSNVAHHMTQLRHLHAGSPSADRELDIDDWIGADWPAIPYSALTNYIIGDIVWASIGGEFYKAKAASGPSGVGAKPVSDTAYWDLLAPPTDWANGSHCRLIRATGFSASHADWTGTYQQSMQGFPNAPSAKLSTLTSNVSGANFQVTTDSADQEKNFLDAKGVAAFVVGAHTLRAGAASGSIGYKIGAAGAVTQPITQQVGLSWQQFMYRPAAATEPIHIDPLELIFVKAANANVDQLSGIGCVVELIGRFGDEDVPAGSEVTTNPSATYRGPTHNAPYPISQWVRAKQAPLSPYAHVGGTYVGNGTAVDLTFRIPPHFLFIRNTASAVKAPRWFSSLPAATRGVDETAAPIDIVRVEVDPTFVGAVNEDDQELRYRVRIAGADSTINGVGVTYQYVAICDPGQRFLSCGASGHDDAGTTDKTNTLERSTFLPDALYIQNQRVEGAAVAAGYYKGPGHGASDATHIAAGSGNVASAASFNGAGSFITKSGLHQANMTLQWMGIRSNDLSGDAAAGMVMRCFTYTGDGNASRTLAIPGGSGVRPLWAMIVPHSTAGAIYRDASHTGVNSVREGGTNLADGITGGAVDQLLVGISANTNTVVFDVWVVMGSATAGNNGWSINGEFMPVDIYDTPTDTDTDPPDPEDQDRDPTTGDPLPEPGEISNDLDLDNETIISSSSTLVSGQFGGQVCEVYTRKVANRALRAIGITKRIADLVNDNTLEATTSRECIIDDINQVLRDFDWPFATAYADLTLVGGTEDVPVNNDWQYSYRAPSGMIKARRIVQRGNVRRTERNQTEPPIKFKLGSDGTGPLVFTDEANDDEALVLEYTMRNTCPSFYGDPLFREAVSWKHAASLAMALSRDSKKQEFCLEMYGIALKRAETPAAQEQQQEPDDDAEWIRGR